jgi:hypothetical protein
MEMEEAKAFILDYLDSFGDMSRARRHTESEDHRAHFMSCCKPYDVGHRLGRVS